MLFNLDPELQIRLHYGSYLRGLRRSIRRQPNQHKPKVIYDPHQLIECVPIRGLSEVAISGIFIAIAEIGHQFGRGKNDRWY
jgi:hypothetical protein